MAPTPKTPTAAKLIPGAVELTSTEQIQLEAEALAEVEAEQKKLAKEQFKKAARDRISAKLQAANGEPEEELVPITIDLAPHSSFIMIDGVRYSHGQTYRFAPASVPTINEIMWRTWTHEAEIKDDKARLNAYRRPHSPRLSGKQFAA
jgi:hypothetical protein